SSMWQALLLVQNGAADAHVTAGNTGALIAISKDLLKTFPGIDRLAICKSLPVEQSSSYMLDLGANLTCTAEQLHQFALMGSVLAASSGISEPTVDRKSTRLNSSHVKISYAVFCLKKKRNQN